MGLTGKSLHPVSVQPHRMKRKGSPASYDRVPVQTTTLSKCFQTFDGMDDALKDDGNYTDLEKAQKDWSEG